jgi:hypothetical protein
MIPTRCGYIIRCSNIEALHRWGTTYIESDEGLVAMEEPTEKDIKHLKDLYSKENATTDIIDYGDIYFSFNQGDYLMPQP